MKCSGSVREFQFFFFFNLLYQTTMTLQIKGGTIVNEEQCVKADLIIEANRIKEIITATDESPVADKVVDATGCYVLPGVIDEHVHFREPGLTDKADIESESRAAAYGGVTTYFDMPNCVPQTTTLEALNDKFRRAKEKSHVNYSFFFGATNDNLDLLSSLPSIPGIKLFMGASTGNMLVDKREALEQIFQRCAELRLPLMTHCEDTNIINANMAAMKQAHGDDPDITLHPAIRSEEACWQSSHLAAELARKYGTHLHIAHLSTARELSLNDPDYHITGEACLAHLLFCDEDYKTIGARIKCNPSVKTAADRDALRKALTDGRITTVGTDHAPHLLAQKQGGAAKATSGMPMLQFSLVSMLSLVDNGVLPIERVTELMAHAPARLFHIKQRGFLRPGYFADITIVRPNAPWTITKDCIQSKCGWSPLEGRDFNWRVEHTFCNGHHIYNNGVFDSSSRGEAVEFDRDC